MKGEDKKAKTQQFWTHNLCMLAIEDDLDNPKENLIISFLCFTSLENMLNSLEPSNA